MLYEYHLQTGAEDFIDITARAADAVRQSGVRDGICLVYSPHTTAGVTINENSDPDVVHDLLLALDKTCPDRPEFRHCEGNSAAHLKASFLGASASVPIEAGRLALGGWQAVYFCEFDGPRSRCFFVKVLGR